eukprot:4335218-Pleurochrysis_carterae.AAC.1
MSCCDKSGKQLPFRQLLACLRVFCDLLDRACPVDRVHEVLMRIVVEHLPEKREGFTLRHVQLTLSLACQRIVA